MKNKIVTLIATVLTLLSISLVAVPSANAYTQSSPVFSRMYYASPYCYLSVWIDYTTWEESWLGGSHVDHREFYKTSTGSRALYTCPSYVPLGYVLGVYSR